MEPMLQSKESLRNIDACEPLEIALIELTKLRAHERVDLAHLKQLAREIESDKILKFAIAVDKDTRIILDGHHRLGALRELGCKRIPVTFVNYRESQIKVKSWRNGYKVTKKMVIEAGLSKKKLPPKTSKHMVVANGKLEHILAIEKKVDFPLKRLT